MIIVHALVEGLMDEAAAIRLIRASGHLPGTVYGKKGCGYIREKVGGFNRAAQGAHFLTLVDLKGTRSNCAPDVISSWLPYRYPRMLFRVVTRDLESWLIADRVNLARFLHVDESKIP